MPIPVEFVTKARLLTMDEWCRVIAEVPNIPIETDTTWFTQGNEDPNIIYFCTGITPGGEINRRVGINGRYGVRPVFEIENTETSGAILRPGGKYILGGHTLCTAISKKLLLADKIICVMTFVKNGIVSNKYDDSYVKEYIEAPSFLKVL